MVPPNVRVSPAAEKELNMLLDRVASFDSSYVVESVISNLNQSGMQDMLEAD